VNDQTIGWWELESARWGPTVTTLEEVRALVGRRFPGGSLLAAILRDPNPIH
jgi:hypothetical protein